MDNRIICICNALEQINEFLSISEFERFQKYIEGLVNDGELTEITVQKRHAGFPEKWYKCKLCPQIWRLVYPDFPFKGIWDIVREEA